MTYNNNREFYAFPQIQFHTNTAIILVRHLPSLEVDIVVFGIYFSTAFTHHYGWSDFAQHLFCLYEFYTLVARPTDRPMSWLRTTDFWGTLHGNFFFNKKYFFFYFVFAHIWATNYCLHQHFPPFKKVNFILLSAIEYFIFAL